MARLETSPLALGTLAPDFTLPNVLAGDAPVSRDSLLAGKQGLLVLFVCVHCPYVQHVEPELARIGHDFADKLGIVAIQPNDIDQYPDDAPAGMRAQATRLGWNFPYLLDSSQQVARAFDAVCTPDIYLFDRDLRLTYHGELDLSRPRRRDSGNDLPLDGASLRSAIHALLAGEPPLADQRPGIGCSIKWRTP